MQILAINPWIYDFAAYDFWLKPYGFLVILSYLKKSGVKVDYIDCLDIKEKYDSFGRGKYPAKIIDKPLVLQSIPRYFKRYGIALGDFNQRLKDKNPDYILISSSMTYWYPAITDLIQEIKKYLPNTPIIIGGTYATLCYQHAKATFPEAIIFRNTDLNEFFSKIGLTFNLEELYSTLPNYSDFYQHLDYLVFRTSWGCPFNCSYCAIKLLSLGSFRLPYQKIITYLLSYARTGLKDFVLYDDAFLYDQDYVKTLLKEIIKQKLNLRFHTPNALHLRYLDLEITQLLKASGFSNPHFGLETLDPLLQKSWGDKVTKEDVINGVKLLKAGGFNSGEFSMYLLLGYPGQDLEKLKNEAEFLHELGAKISLAEFSPVPQTRLFNYYADNFSAEPLLHNNSIFGTFQKNKLQEFWDIKNYIRILNKKFAG